MAAPTIFRTNALVVVHKPKGIGVDLCRLATELASSCRAVVLSSSEEKNLCVVSLLQLENETMEEWRKRVMASLKGVKASYRLSHVEVGLVPITLSAV